LHSFFFFFKKIKNGHHQNNIAYAYEQVLCIRRQTLGSTCGARCGKQKQKIAAQQQISGARQTRFFFFAAAGDGGVTSAWRK